MTPIRLLRLGLVMLFLIFESVIDIKKREISITASVIISLIAVLLIVFAKDIHILSMVFGLCEGILLMILSHVSKEQIGFGDGIILCATGLILGWKDNLTMFFFSCLICALFSICLMTIKKADKRTKIPFVPFMVPGFILSVISEGL